MHILLELVALAALGWVLVTSYRAFADAVHRTRTAILLLSVAWLVSIGWFVLLILGTWRVRDIGGWPLLTGPAAAILYRLQLKSSGPRG